MMKMFKILPLAALLLTAGMTTAQAGVDLEKVTQVEGDITFKAPAHAGGSITPQKDLVAGLVTKEALIATADLKAENNAQLAYRWTPGSGTIDPNDNKVITVSGITQTNLLQVYLQDGTKAMRVLDENWFGVDDTDNSSTHLAMRAFKDQTVAADTYKLSLDVAVWED